MKKFYLIILDGTSKGFNKTVVADYFIYTFTGIYKFYLKGSKGLEGFEKLIASYPISRTIIERIEEIEEK